MRRQNHHLEQDDAVATALRGPNAGTFLLAQPKPSVPEWMQPRAKPESAGQVFKPCCAHSSREGAGVEAATPLSSSCQQPGPSKREAREHTRQGDPWKVFSKKIVGALVEAFKQNREAASQSPGKKYKWKDKGKEKVSGMDEPRDPEQPGPSNAVLPPCG